MGARSIGDAMNNIRNNETFKYDAMFKDIKRTMEKSEQRNDSIFKDIKRSVESAENRNDGIFKEIKRAIETSEKRISSKLSQLEVELYSKLSQIEFKVYEIDKLVVKLEKDVARSAAAGGGPRHDDVTSTSNIQSTVQELHNVKSKYLEAIAETIMCGYNTQSESKS